MPTAASDPLLDSPRIRTLAKHSLIVVGLEHEKTAPPKRVADGCGWATEVRCYSDPESGGRVVYDDRYGVYRVVTGWDRFDREVGHGEPRSA